jgi:2-oxoglutarate ferredoxin oxidoreductase subunit beta
VSATKHETYMTDAHGPLAFCPGCGHHVIAKALDKAMVKLQLDPTKVVLVTDIGCIGLTCKYFATSAFHGLHGRSITYACGLKLARPELQIIAIKGDGGCGIGGTHLLNVARRNIGITLIVANNFNYGMTGGQHSVTTPTDGITSTTPWGNIEAPMDLCATAVAAGAAWVRRATAFDKDLPDVIASAIEQPGFAMIDIWELCTAYYTARNAMKKKDLFALLERHELTVGQQVDKPRLEYSERCRQGYEARQGTGKKPRLIEPCFDSSLDRQIGLVIAGSAGQKIKSTATLFAEGAMFAGLSATQKDDYPITVQTGHSVAEVIVSPQRIEYTGIEAPEYMVVLSDDGLRRVGSKLAKLPASSVVYADQSLDLPPTAAKVLTFPFAEAAKKVGKLSVGTVALAALLEDTDLYPIEAYGKAIGSFQSPKIAAVNTDALNAGAALAHQPEA